ncbi:MAG: histidine phosphatase family protein [Bacteroidales bacterium]|nr:histidine phosphatase family protein [Bacteroidales bacterium]
MKNLLVMRHAKSDWGNNLPDIERPLNNRGKKAAPLMADYLKKVKKNPDIILSSPAKRAMSTAKIMKEKLELDKDIIIIKAFYFGFMNELMNTIKAIDNKYETVLIVGHNPVWEDLVSDLTGEAAYIMPTAAIASIIFNTDDWQKITETDSKLEWSVTPKFLKK